MNAFLRMQLKIYFRLISSYVTPLVVGLLYIIITIAMKASVSPDEAKELLTGNKYAEIQTNIVLFSIFMVGSFVAQTFFYRYRKEGVDYILFSKPIKRSQIYFANIIASFIGSLFSAILITIEYFISQIMIPVSAYNAFISSLTFLAVSLVGAVFVIGIASVIQALVESKVFQVMVAVVPLLFLLGFGFIKSPEQADSLLSISKAAKNPTLLVENSPSKQSDANKAVDNLQDRFRTQTNWVVANQSLTGLFENANDLNFNPLSKDTTPDKILSVTDYVDKSKKSFYDKIYWANYREYIFPLLVAYDKNLLNLSVLTNYQRNLNGKDGIYYKVLDKNGNLDNETNELFKKEYALDLKKYLLIKTSNNDILSLNYNVNNFREVFQWEQDSNKLFQFKFDDIQNRAFDIFKDFNSQIIDKIVENDPSSTQLFDNFIYDNIGLKQDLTGDKVDAVKLALTIKYTSEILGARINNANDFDHIFNKIVNELNTKANDSNTLEELKPFYKQLASINSIPNRLLLKALPIDKFNNEIDKYVKKMGEKLTNVTPLQKAKIEAYQKVIKTRMINSLIKGFVTIRLMKNVSINPENGEFKTIIDNKNIKPFLAQNQENYLMYAKDYKNNIFQLMKLNDNLISFERVEPFNAWSGTGITLLVSATLITLGYVLFKRKNFS